MRDLEASKTVGNKTGAIFVLIVIIVVIAGFALMLNPPLVNHYTPVSEPASGAKHYVNITLYADAQGWDYNHGTADKTFAIANNTMVYFTVIEEDNQPHTLTINPGSTESSASYAYTLLGTSDITTSPGHVSHAQIFFGVPGVYTYWCIIHPTTMVGLIYVNNTTTPSPNNTVPVYAHYANESMTLQNNSFMKGTQAYPTMTFQNGTLLNLSITDSIQANYSLLVSPGTGINQSNYVPVINTTNASSTGSIALNQTGEYSYWNGNNTTSYGTILVYSSLSNITLYADANGWNFSQSSGVNPSLSFGEEVLVNFTVKNQDNLSHSLVIASGSNESSNYTTVATVNSTQNTSYGYYFFLIPGNYTYWDTHHPGTAVGSITVAGSAGATSVVRQETYLSDLTTEYPEFIIQYAAN